MMIDSRVAMATGITPEKAPVIQSGLAFNLNEASGVEVELF